MVVVVQLLVVQHLEEEEQEQRETETETGEEGLLGSFFMEELEICCCNGAAEAIVALVGNPAQAAIFPPRQSKHQTNLPAACNGISVFTSCCNGILSGVPL